MRTPPTRRAPTALILTLAVSASACRCDDRPAIEADRSDGVIPELVAPQIGASAAPKIDGELDDPAWATAGKTGWFVRVHDGKADPSSKVNAWAKVIWDRERLYFAFAVYDREPSSPFAPRAEDPHIWERASAVELMIQPGDPRTNQNYFEIQVDTARAVWDTRFDDYNRPISRGRGGQRIFGHQRWRSEVERAVRIERDRGRYLLELAIPWRVFSSERVTIPPTPGDVWRINLYSFRDGQRSALAWSPILGRGNFHRASRFGRVRFGRGRK